MNAPQLVHPPDCARPMNAPQLVRPPGRARTVNNPATMERSRGKSVRAPEIRTDLPMSVRS